MKKLYKILTVLTLTVFPFATVSFANDGDLANTMSSLVHELGLEKAAPGEPSETVTISIRSKKSLEQVWKEMLKTDLCFEAGLGEPTIIGAYLDNKYAVLDVQIGQSFNTDRPGLQKYAVNHEAGHLKSPIYSSIALRAKINQMISVGVKNMRIDANPEVWKSTYAESFKKLGWEVRFDFRSDTDQVDYFISIAGLKKGTPLPNMFNVGMAFKPFRKNQQP